MTVPKEYLVAWNIKIIFALHRFNSLVMLGSDTEIASSETISTMVRLKPGESVWKTQDNHLICEKGSFYFNKVFENTTNVGIFEHCWELLKIVLQGINTTCFTYGQTSSGKTYTLLGTDVDPGLLPLTLQQLFEIEGLVIKISYIEVYNEILKDLLEPENVPKLQTSNNHVTIANLLQVQVNTYEEAINYLKIGECSRKYGYTDANEHSSRSHALFQIHVQRQLDDRTTYGLLTLVDLAGSERIKHTNAEGARLKEGQMINKSLLALGTVIQKLSEKQSHVPFRDSKLTRILQNSLGGYSRTIAICCITPDEDHCDESISTLKFALKTMRVENKPIVNESKSEEQLLNQYKQQINQLQEKLEKQEDSVDFIDQLECYKQQQILLKQRIHELENPPLKRRHSSEELPLSKRVKLNPTLLIVDSLLNKSYSRLLLNQQVRQFHLKHHFRPLQQISKLPLAVSKMPKLDPILSKVVRKLALLQSIHTIPTPAYISPISTISTKFALQVPNTKLSHFKSFYPITKILPQLPDYHILLKAPISHSSPAQSPKSLKSNFLKIAIIINHLSHLIKPLHSYVPVTHIISAIPQIRAPQFPLRLFGINQKLKDSLSLLQVENMQHMTTILPVLLHVYYKLISLRQFSNNQLETKMPIKMTAIKDLITTKDAIVATIQQESQKWLKMNKKMDLYLSTIQSLEQSKLEMGHEIMNIHGNKQVIMDGLHTIKGMLSKTVAYEGGLALKMKINKMREMAIPVEITKISGIQSMNTINYEQYTTISSDLGGRYAQEKEKLKNMLGIIKQDYKENKLKFKQYSKDKDALAIKNNENNEKLGKMSRELEKSKKTIQYLKEKLMDKMNDQKIKEMEVELANMKKSLQEAQAKIIMMDSKNKKVEHERNSVGHMYKELKQKTLNAQEFLQKQSYIEDPNKTINELNENCNLQ